MAESETDRALMRSEFTPEERALIRAALLIVPSPTIELPRSPDEEIAGEES